MVSELPPDELSSNVEAQTDELTAVVAIYEREMRVVKNGATASGRDASAPPADELEPIVPDVPTPGAVIELKVALDAPLVDTPPVARVRVPPALRNSIPRVASTAASGDDDSDDASAALWPVDSLPPLVLRLRLPATYPSRAPPVFGMRCAWLSDDELAQLCVGADQLCAEARGSPVLCEIVEWLRSDALPSLSPDLLRGLELPTGGAADSGAEMDGSTTLGTRAARWPRSAAEVLTQLVAHSQDEAERVWRESLHDCGVCFETHTSLDCIRFVRCGHTFCKGCASGYFASLMSDGAHAALTCPEPSCRLTATPPEVKALLPAAVYEQHERLTLQSSLATMRDMTWCPVRARTTPPAAPLFAPPMSMSMSMSMHVARVRSRSCVHQSARSDASTPRSSSTVRTGASHCAANAASRSVRSATPRGMGSRPARTSRRAGVARMRRARPCCVKSTARASSRRWPMLSGCCSTRSPAPIATRTSRRMAAAIISRAVTATSSGAGSARASTSRATTATARASSSPKTSLRRSAWSRMTSIRISSS